MSPVDAQIIACSLHLRGEGGSHKQIRESDCQFHRIDSTSVCTRALMKRVTATELHLFSPVELHRLCPRQRMVSRAHTSAESTWPARTAVRFRHLVPKAQKTSVILYTLRIFESSCNCDVIQQRDYSGFSRYVETLTRLCQDRSDLKVT